MKIHKIQVQNVKSFENAELTFNEDFNIFIGANGSGKSNMLDILTICLKAFFIYSYEEKIVSGRTNITKQNYSSTLSGLLDKFNRSTNSQNIIIEFIVTDEDIKNIELIHTHLDTFQSLATNYEIDRKAFSKSMWKTTNLKPKQNLSYTINNLTLQTNGITPEQRFFLNYLNYCELFSILGKKNNINFQPLHLYFSPNRPTSIAFDNINLSSYMSNRTQQNDTILETSKSSNGNFYQANVIYFIKKKVYYQSKAKLRLSEELWKEDEEVQLLDKYFDKLGYTWEVDITDPYTNIGSILLHRNSEKYNIQQASSGEREIINFLLSICASNIKNGIIVIDEPEIHLHPRWQNFLLDILLELSKVTKNQFIISTHSPSFVNQKSYNYVFRFYKESNISRVTELKLAEVKTALHVIKSSNNEKIFFADAIIFVEGIKDLLIFQPILEKKLKEKNSLQIVEIIDIGGKRNFPMFKEIAENIKIPYFFIADLDYVNEADKTGAIKKLFNPDLPEISKQMKSSKSEDGNKLALLLEEAISQGNITEKLRETFEYVKSNRKRLRDDLSKEEQKELDDFIQSQEENNIYILNKGAIEKYLPDGYKSKNSDDLTKIISSLLDTTKDDYQTWIISLEYADLEAIIAKIISKL